MTTPLNPTMPAAPHPLIPEPPDSDTVARGDVRNVAIVTHVDHGKTTLVDAILRQTGTFRSNQVLVDRVMDSMDLEREKGITILGKQTTVEYAGNRHNIVDTRDTPTSAARWSAACSWWTPCCSWWTRPKGRCRRPATCSRRRLPAASPTG